jgi:hypothetical protein
MKRYTSEDISRVIVPKSGSLVEPPACSAVARFAGKTKSQKKGKCNRPKRCPAGGACLSGQLPWYECAPCPTIGHRPCSTAPTYDRSHQRSQAAGFRRTQWTIQTLRLPQTVDDGRRRKQWTASLRTTNQRTGESAATRAQIVPAHAVAPRRQIGVRGLLTPFHGSAS